ncbi:MAG: leucine-rich repeat domain-containing protein [Prevotella sp.]|nr:leucine-rich repeat domain-containing protein [Prevotella sp.]
MKRNSTLKGLSRASSRFAKVCSLLALLLLTAQGAWAEVVASGNCGTTDHESEVTYSLTNDGVLTISGTGTMADFGNPNFQTPAPWLPSYANSITSVVIESGVTSVGNYAFYGCNNLTSITLPANLQTIGNYAFVRCGMTSITLPASLETIGMRAFQAVPITSINIPASVTSIGELAFGLNSSLAEITVDANNTIYEAPNGCNALIVKATHTLILGCNETVFANLPDGLTTLASSAFAGCTGLTTATFPDGLESIGESAFEECSSLASVTLPVSMKNIGRFAFQYCKSLTTVTINAANLETYGEDAFLNANSGMKIYVPYGSGNTYKTGWPAYASMIEELEDPNATYTVKLAENTDDVTNWTIAPAEATTTGVKKNTEVKATYSGTRHVKSVTAAR